MHLVMPKKFRFVETTPHSLRFAGDRSEKLEVYVLEEDLIRVKHLPDGVARLDRTWTVVGPNGEMPREGRLRDDLSPFSRPQYAAAAEREFMLLNTEELSLKIDLSSFSIEWADGWGRVFARDLRNHAYTYDQRGRSVFHYLVQHPDEHYYGFGEKAGPLDKRGMRMRMQNLDAIGYSAKSSDPLYKHWPFYITFVPELNIAYGLFYDNLATSVFDMGQEVNGLKGATYRYYQAEDGDLDYYLIYGPSIEAVIEKFTRLTGRPTLPPRWSLGYLGSTMSYTDAPNAQAQLKQFVDLCQAHEIPCDMFHLSSGYTTNAQGKRCVFTWNRSRVPNPQQMVSNFEQAGIHLAANIKPYLLEIHPYYDEVRRQQGFIQDAEADTPAMTQFWSGGVYEYDEGSQLDLSNPITFDWWKRQVREALLEYGIKAIWNDNNEFEFPDDQARCAGFGQPLSLGMVRPLLTLLMGMASFQAMQEYQPQERPFLLTRSGCPGIQRYAQTWSGDNSTSWETLQYNIPMGLGLSLSGMPNTGHDVGGFAGPKPSPELFVRWMQNGIFSPRFTIHSWNSDATTNEPWMHPEVLPLIREAIQFRYRLLPYLYTLFFEATQTGHPIIRPMLYHFPDDPHCWTESFDFMLGPNLLVASVYEEGATTRSVYLPENSVWYDFYLGRRYVGGQTIIVDAPLNHIPLFARENSIIPMGKLMRHVGEQPDDLRLAYVFPSPGTGQASFTLIEDDGLSLDYQAGKYAKVQLIGDCTPDSISFSIGEVIGEFELPYHQIDFVLPPDEKRPIHGTDRISMDSSGRRHAIVSF